MYNYQPFKHTAAIFLFMGHSFKSWTEIYMEFIWGGGRGEYMRRNIRITVVFSDTISLKFVM